MILQSKCFHGKTQIANKLISSIIYTKCPKNDLEIGLSSVVINTNKSLKNASMETTYFIKMFTWKKRVLHTKNEQKEVAIEAKRQEKRLKAIRKNLIDKNKESILGELMHIIQRSAYFRPFMQTIIACM